MGRRALGPQADTILDLDRRRRDALSSLQDMQQRRNRGIEGHRPEAKRESRDAGTLIAEVSELKRSMPAQEEEARALAAQLHEILSGLPNVPGPDVPDGEDESANAELRRVGDPPRFDFAPKQHFELGEALGGLDFEAAGKLAGARFTVMRGTLARLHRAIGQFMLDLHVDEHGYSEVNSPVLVRDEVCCMGPRSCRSSATTCFAPKMAGGSSDGGGNAYQPRHGPDFRGRRAAAAGLRPHPVLSFRGRGRRQGHARHAAPAPIREGRDGIDRPSRP